ncbi:MAG TPA: type IV pilus twitching motility protein PilT [Candidatus Methylomirabilis sp.]|nr:type IV pilus twitching motility protein PilT [Candidatus Methylomirabilis sp.]
MGRIDSFLELVVRQNGSDLHLVAGNPPRIRLYGELFPVKYRDLTPEETADLIAETMTESVRRAFESRHSLDYAYEVGGFARFRVNAFRHLGGLGAVLRVIRTTIQTLDELNMPPVLKTFCKQRKGLILVTGPTGSGKSTTLAAMIDYINQDRKEHIVTIEDPVEFIHPRKNCLISQREIGLNADSFATALRSSLREDANVVLVGELRDLETIGLAVTAAETGILVLATLHTSSAAATVDRMVNVFPAREQALIRSMLSTSLCGVVSQQLVRRADGKGMLAAVEVLVNNAAVANILREGKTELLASVIQAGALVGMQSLDNSLRNLVDAKLITGGEAYRKASNKAAFEQFREPDEA